MLRAVGCFCLILAIGPSVTLGGDPIRPLIRFELDGAAVEGTSLFWTKSDAVVLARDGRVLHFEPKQAKNLRRSNAPFRSHSTVRLRSELQREFGSAFEVTSAGHYLVVHPRGQGRQWSRRFEELYRSFRIYFSVRGFKLKEPEFPLVAVVLRSREEFQRYMRRDRVNLTAGVLGYYSPISNRVVLYDVTGGRDVTAWYANAETIIHEATHQTAFNTGVHNRFSPPPRWVAEGLGTLFEARGVWDSRRSASAAERVNRGRLAQFRRYRSRRKSDATVQLISSDGIFRTDPEGAYADAWALTFYLTETRPQKYADYLARTAKVPDFQHYRASQRLADFTAVFGENFRLFDAHFLQFMKQIR